MKIAKRAVSLLMAAAIMLTALSVTSFAAAEGWFSRAEAMTNGQSVSGTLTTENKDAYYKFTLKRTGYVLLEASASFVNRDAGLSFEMFDSNGRSMYSKTHRAANIGSFGPGYTNVWFNPEKGGRSARGKLMYSPLDAGVYYLKMYTVAGCDYTITPHFYETKDCFGNSQALAMDGGQTVQLDVANEETVYRFNVNKNGTFKLDCSPDNMNAEFSLFKDEESGKVRVSKTTGAVSAGGGNDFMFVTDKLDGCAAEYELASGTYYLRVKRTDNEVWGSTVSFTPSFKEAPAPAAKGEIGYLGVTLKKGSELQLGAVMTEKGDVTWSSSKKTVATVSKTGKITAKKKGTAIITAKTGANSVKIKITVK